VSGDLIGEVRNTGLGSIRRRKAVEEGQRRLSPDEPNAALIAVIVPFGKSCCRG